MKNKNKNGNGRRPRAGPVRYPTPKLSNNRLAPSVNSMPRGKLTNVTQMALSKCALKYALAVSDPLSINSRGACVPVGASPTMKTHAFARIDVTIGENGHAYVVMCPSLANDLPSFFYTDTVYTGSRAQLNPFITAGDVATRAGLQTGVIPGYHNGPFGATQLFGFGGLTDPELQGRAVAVGARAQYIGKTLDEAGLYYCYHDPAHSSVAGNDTQNISLFGDTNVEAITRMPCTLTMFAVDDSEFDFSVADPSLTKSSILALYPFSRGRTEWDLNSVGSSSITPFWRPQGYTGAYDQCLGCPTGCLQIQGTPGSTVHVEMQFHFEYVGRPAAAMLTPVTPDVVGANSVRTSALSAPQRKLANPTASTWDIMYAGLKEVYNAAKPVVVPIAQNMLMSMML